MYRDTLLCFHSCLFPLLGLPNIEGERHGYIIRIFFMVEVEVVCTFYFTSYS